MAKKESGREEVQDYYEGHEIDIDTAVDRFSILEDGAKDSPVMASDDDTEVVLGPKTQEKPNDPYCNC
jgi:hypothetical protein